MNLLPLLPLLLVAPFLWLRLRGYLLFFQQEEYDRRRFLRWLRETGARDRATSLAALVAGVLLFAGEAIPRAVPMLLLVAGLAEGMRRSLRPTAGAKKALAMTARARRIHLLAFGLGTSLAVALQAAAGMTGAGGAVLAVLVAAQAAPFLLPLADALLAPFERRVKARFRAEAVDKLARLEPFVIGITGSYGKTSVKHILHHILSAAAPTLMTPGSVNTEMGITRVVREKLTPEHRYFIVEMGAYGPGSIARLCRLAPPGLGVITAVGLAHYERFRSVEAVFHAKFELADAVAAAGGTTVVAADAVPPELLAARLAARPEGIRTVGTSGAPRLAAARQTPAGLELDLAGEGEPATTLAVPLHGEHQADNVLVAVAAARELGLPMETIRAALATMPQIRHRLEVSRGGGIAVIDDAYNSNPKGFAAALALLDTLVGPGGRRILVTPGMVELGARHEEEHARLGALAARHVDLALVVTPERIEGFVAAFLAGKGENAELLRFARQAEAETHVRALLRPGDAVLYENNLPDLYEARPRF